MPVDAAMPISPARPAIEPPDLPVDAPALLPRERDDAAIAELAPAAGRDSQPVADSPDRESVVALPNRPPIAADAGHSDLFDPPDQRSNDHDETADRRPQFVVQASRLQTAGGTPAPQRATTAPTDESFDAPSAAESFAADSDPAFERPHRPMPVFAAATDPPPGPDYPADDFADDSFAPAARSATNAGSSRDQSSLDAVGEATRQLEQTARDLETSLTHLFTTQIETLQRLRDRVDEQERRWVEQQSARRATL